MKLLFLLATTIISIYAQNPSTLKVLRANAELENAVKAASGSLSNSANLASKNAHIINQSTQSTNPSAAITNPPVIHQQSTKQQTSTRSTTSTDSEEEIETTIPSQYDNESQSPRITRPSKEINLGSGSKNGAKSKKSSFRPKIIHGQLFYCKDDEDVCFRSKKFSIPDEDEFDCQDTFLPIDLYINLKSEKSELILSGYLNPKSFLVTHKQLYNNVCQIFKM
jgi:hypothetical protein